MSIEDLSTSQYLQTCLKVDLPPTRVSNRSNESNISIFNHNAKAKDDAMNECDAPVLMRTRAHELNTRKVPRMTEVSNYGSYCPAILDGPTTDVIA